MKKKILFINLYTEMGGGEYSVYYLVKELDKSRFRPIMLFNKRGAFVEMIESLGVETSIVPFPAVMLKRLIEPKVIWKSLKASRELRRFLEKNEVDLIHCSDVLTLLLIAIPAARCRIPVIYSVIFFYEPARMVLLNVLALLGVKRIIANSRAVKENLLRRTLFLSQRVETLYQGVDADQFRPSRNGEAKKLRDELRVEPGTKLVGMVGRFDPSKGHKIFLRAAASVLQKRKDVKFVIVGGLLNEDVIPSLRKYQDSVIHFAEELDLGNHLSFLSHGDDIPDVIRSLDVLVCPSVSEGFGLTVLEGVASGVPVVVSRSTGALEVVDGMDSVFVAETGDPLSFAARIHDAFEPRKKPTSASPPTGRPGKLKDLSWHDYAKRVEKIYDSEF
jgi:glycosyltransferase involved in cell wall biosynthesis